MSSSSKTLCRNNKNNYNLYSFSPAEKKIIGKEELGSCAFYTSMICKSP
jgi:hypothetical protein